MPATLSKPDSEELCGYLTHGVLPVEALEYVSQFSSSAFLIPKYVRYLLFLVSVVFSRMKLLQSKVGFDG